MTFNETKIKEVLASRLGRRLLSCMLLVQPITAKELQQFPNLAFELFNPAHPITDRRDFPNVANISLNESYPLFKPIFSSNKELYNRVLKKAIDSELVLRVPRKKGWKKNYYHFINSDLLFDINAERIETIKIKENKEVFSSTFKHHIRNYLNNGESILHEKLNFRRKIMKETSDETIYPIYSLEHIFSLFWWLTKHPKLIRDTIDVFRLSSSLSNKKRIVKREDLPLDWHRLYYLYRKGIQEKVISYEMNRFFLNLFFIRVVVYEV